MYDYYETDPKENFDNYVKEKMQEQYDLAILYFGKLVRPDLAEGIAHCVALAYNEEEDEALSLVDSIGLTQMDMWAIGNCYVPYYKAIEKFTYNEILNGCLDVREDLDEPQFYNY